MNLNSNNEWGREDMSNLAAIVIDDQEYVPVMKDGEIVSYKKFNAKYGMWVEIKCTNNSLDAENELLEMLKNEYCTNIFGK